MRIRLVVISLLFAALAFARFPSIALAQEHDFVFDGNVGFEDLGSYIDLDFDVPAGTTKITVAYSYQSANATQAESENRLFDAGAGDYLTNDADALLSPVIDIGIYDPDGFRGWSGSNKNTFTVALSRDQTTDSYIPGEMPAGVWQVELGVGFVFPGGTLNYNVTVDLSAEDVGDAFVPSDYSPVTLSEEARWYKGDLHCHSTHSDGSRTMAEAYDYAHSIGLDFLAISDHNAVSQNLYVSELQENYSDMLLIRAIEVTSYKGHWNAFDVGGYVDYHGTAPGYDINAVIGDVHARGGFVSPNHPGHPLIAVSGGLYGWGFGYTDADWAQIDFIEAVNGPSRVYGFLPNPLNWIGTGLWDHFQSRGFTLSVRGGSDDHQGGQGSGDTYSPIGAPTTVVYAERLNAQAILKALKAGHAFIMTESPDGPEVYLTTSFGDQTAMVGDSLQGNEIDVTANVKNGNGWKLALVKDGRQMPGFNDIAIEGDDFLYHFSYAPDSSCRIRAEIWDGVILKAITNSIFLSPSPLADDDTEADDATDDTVISDDSSGDDIADDDSLPAASDDDDNGKSGCGC